MVFLTKLEGHFLLAVFHHISAASSMNIREYLLDKNGKDLAFASLYIALNMREKNNVESFKGEPKNA